MTRKREIILLTCCVLVTIRALYEFRHIPWIGSYLSVLVAFLLIYPAYWHAESRKMRIPFFERDGRSVLSSVRLFAILALAIFPPFLVANHFCQKIFFDADFRPQAFNISWTTVPTQVLLVALPEEFFFRGYLQTLISRRADKSFRFLGIPILTMSWGVPLAALVFASAHTFITFRWWHFAIFFPALAFGWLREKTTGLVAPVLFHALSNLVVSAIGNLYR